MQVISSAGEVAEGGPTVAIACGQRVFLLRFDAASAEFKVTILLLCNKLFALSIIKKIYLMHVFKAVFILK